MATTTIQQEYTPNPDHIRAQSLIAAGDFAGARVLLENIVGNDSGGRTAALKGLCCFHAENYREAVSHYKQAVELATGEPEWQRMLSVCQANVAAEADRVVPPVFHFDRAELLATPPEPALPSAPAPLKLPYMLHKLRYLRLLVGSTAGVLGTNLFNFLTNTIGKHYSGKIWTNWYLKSVPAGILTMAYMREKLNSDNLFSTYPKNAKIGFLHDDLQPPQGVTHFRTADGSWNNLANPKEGAAHTRFMRNVHDAVIKPDENLMSPNPRLVSLKLLTRGQQMKEVKFLNMLAAAWIQFQNSDWISHGENTSTATIEIPFPDNDPARERYHQSKMTVKRTQPDPSYQGADKEKTPVTFVNEVTHWWDGSQIYGSNQQTQDRLRSHVNGRLKLEADGRLPLNEQNVEDTGFNRNWWVGQAMLHNLFVREHNVICDQLFYSYPDWDDNRLFNVARLINAAVMAKIHSIEWTPAVLPNKRLSIGLNANWYGILTYLRESQKQEDGCDFQCGQSRTGRTGWQ